MDHLTRAIASVITGAVATVVAFLFLVPAGCNDVGGVPTWERCTSFLGTPAFSVEGFGWDNTLDVIQPVLVGLLVGLITWGLMGLSSSSGDGAQSQSPGGTPRSPNRGSSR
jgi:hypothetical protein